VETKTINNLFRKIVMFIFVYATMFFVTQRVFTELRKECPILAEEYRKMWGNIYLGLIIFGTLFWLLYIRGVF